MVSGNEICYVFIKGKLVIFELFTPIRLHVLDLVQKYWHKGIALLFFDHVQLLFDLCQESA